LGANCGLGCGLLTVPCLSFNNALAPPYNVGKRPIKEKKGSSLGGVWSSFFG